jgi:hypothetical protein
MAGTGRDGRPVALIRAPKNSLWAEIAHWAPRSLPRATGAVRNRWPSEGPKGCDQSHDFLSFRDFGSGAKEETAERERRERREGRDRRGGRRVYRKRVLCMSARRAVVHEFLLQNVDLR